MSTVSDTEFAILQNHANLIIDRIEVVGFESLSEAERVFFLVWIADGEINNGGFHAVCYNSTGDYTYLFRDAFRAIGAERKAELFQVLIAAFGENGVPNDQPTRYEAHCTLKKSDIRKIDNLDDRYFDAPEPIDKLLLNWVRQFDVGG